MRADIITLQFEKMMVNQFRNEEDENVDKCDELIIEKDIKNKHFYYYF